MKTEFEGKGLQRIGSAAKKALFEHIDDLGHRRRFADVESGFRSKSHPLDFEPDDLRAHVLARPRRQVREFQADDLSVPAANLDVDVFDPALVVQGKARKSIAVLQGSARLNQVDTGAPVAQVEDLRQVLPGTDVQNDHVFIGADGHDPQGTPLFVGIRHHSAVHMTRIDRSNPVL